MLKAVYIEKILGPAVAGMNSDEQVAIDSKLVEQGSGIGANATLAVSCAVARASAIRAGVPLWRYLAGQRMPKLPTPMVNIISGGLHAGKQLEFQDFLVIPRGYPDLSTALEAVTRVHRATGDLLAKRGAVLTGVADEGGWGPRLESNEDAVSILREAITESGTGRWTSRSMWRRRISSTGRGIGWRAGFSSTALGHGEDAGRWIPRYGVTSIEDPPAGRRLGRLERVNGAAGGHEVRLVGDDLFATNAARLDRGIREGVANAVFVKMNQIGTLTQTFGVIDRAKEAAICGDFGAVGRDGGFVPGGSGGGFGSEADQDRVGDEIGAAGQIQPVAGNREVGDGLREYLRSQ